MFAPESLQIIGTDKKHMQRCRLANAACAKRTEFVRAVATQGEKKAATASSGSRKRPLYGEWLWSWATLCLELSGKNNKCAVLYVVWVRALMLMLVQVQMQMHKSGGTTALAVLPPCGQILRAGL